MTDYIIKLKRPRKSLWNDPFVWRMAWKDARQNKSRLFLFVSSVIIGIAALVSINSFNINLQANIDSQAKDLLGADFVISASEEFNSELIAAMDSAGGKQASEATMASMVRFMTSTPGTRLIRLVAMEGDFPFYGEVETTPPNALNQMKEQRMAMLDQNLATSYDVSSSDSLSVGRLTFNIAGEVLQIPNGGGVQSTFTPSVYIDMDWLDSTGLVQYGSRITYKRYFAFDTEEEVTQAMETLEPIARKFGYSVDDVQERKEDLGRGFENLYRFFSLLAFIALILGSIGVASSIHIYVREKRNTVAVLRCIGASGWQTFYIFLIQSVFLGIVGSLVGVFIGLFLQFSLPFMLAEFIPLDLDIGIAWEAIFNGLFMGIIISVLFSLLPLLRIRFIPPLSVLRTNTENIRTRSKSTIFVATLIILFPFLVATYQTRDWLMGLSFFAGLITAFGVLTALAYLVMWAVRKFFPSRAGFILRQSLANLFRPNNQTTVLMVVIGLGVFLISTLQIVQNSLLNQVEFVGQENQSNTILFDIQPEQKEGVIELTRANNLPLNQIVPIVTTRLSEIHGKSVEEVQKDTTDGIRNWALTREYRITYRDSLTASEKLLEGSLQRVSGDSIYVTISEGMQDNLQVKVGDSLEFDVQGIPFKVYISGIREVDWPKDPPNFIFVFPSGVLEEAPQIFVLTTRIDDDVAANTYQRELVTAFPNVSLIDIRLILATIDDFFNKVKFIIQFMALFSIITGLIVLAGAVLNSRHARLKENVLLRTIGASGKQIIGMTLLEYVYLGVLAGLTGIFLSLFSSWVLATYFFEIVFRPYYPSLLIIWVGVVMLTVLVGWWNTRQVINESPLSVLRREG
jgi:putative ABC transport system permease protein